MTDKHIADLSVDKSVDNSVWIKMGKLRIDRPYLTAMGKQLKSAWISLKQES
jgi:hypothetical protein